MKHLKTYGIVIGIALVIGLAVWFIRKKLVKPWNNPAANPNNVDTKIFPLGYGSRGREVEIVQYWLNAQVLPPVRLLAEDGIWGPNTEGRFNELMPDVNGVDENLYKKMYNEVKEFYKDFVNEY